MTGVGEHYEALCRALDAYAALKSTTWTYAETNDGTRYHVSIALGGAVVWLHTARTKTEVMRAAADWAAATVEMFVHAERA